MEKYEAKPEILLDQHEITPKIMMKNIWKPDAIQIMICLNKILQLYNMIIVVRSVFHEGNKYYQEGKC